MGSTLFFTHKWGFTEMVVPPNGSLVMEYHLKLDDLRVPPCMDTPTSMKRTSDQPKRNPFSLGIRKVALRRGLPLRCSSAVSTCVQPIFAGTFPVTSEFLLMPEN